MTAPTAIKMNHSPAKWNIGEMLLSAAAYLGDAALVKMLLADDQVDVNAKDRYGRTPLSWAAEKGQLAVVGMLLADDQVDINAAVHDGLKPWLWAELSRQQIIYKTLFEKVGNDIFGSCLEWLQFLFVRHKKYDALNTFELVEEEPKEEPVNAPTYLIIMWPIIQLLIFLARRLQTLLRGESSLDRFSEFPNRRRPPCTTMPWNIWPALVVLWGVCWMFYTPSTTPRPDEFHATWQNGLLNPHPDNSFYDSIIDGSWVFPEGTLEEYQRTYDLEAPPISASSNSWIDPLPQGYGDFARANASPTGVLPVPEVLEQTAMHPLALAASSIPDQSQDRITRAQHVNPDSLLRSNTVSRSQSLIPSSSLTTLPTTQAASLTEQTVPAPQPSSTDGDTRQPTLNSEGRLICDRDGCDCKTFQNRSDWKKHMDKHDRPYKCPVTTCPHRNGFTSKGDLERHKKSLHPELAPRQNKQDFYCPEQGCSRSVSSTTKNPFKRKDHLGEHIKRIHNGLTVAAPADVHSSPDSLTIAQHAPDLARNGLGNPPHQSRTSVFGARKRRRLETNLPSETADSSHEGEMEELRRKLADSERDLELERAARADLERRLRLSKEREAKLAELVSHYTKQAD